MDALSPYFSLAAMIIALIGAGVSLYKAKPERKKINAESDSEIGNAADSIASGAKTVVDQLRQRMQELDARDAEREKVQAEMRRELRDVKSALADWQDWARRLVHQVKSLGYEPVPFKIEELKPEGKGK
jgi:uncharacterized coiled-coil protein SlyX